MRPLTEEEWTSFSNKLQQYLSADTIIHMTNQEEDPWVFCVLELRVYYMSDTIAKLAGNVGRDELMHAGVCFGKFTRSKKFRLHITCLDILAKHAKHKIWLKPNGEQAYLYGNHVIKAHLAKMSENVPQYAGVLVYSLYEVPLGFGVAARSTLQCKDIDPTSMVVFNQADLGEYLRVEDDEKN